jgi:hypothetical protein
MVSATAKKSRGWSAARTVPCSIAAFPISEGDENPGRNENKEKRQAGLLNQPHKSRAGQSVTIAAPLPSLPHIYRTPEDSYTSLPVVGRIPTHPEPSGLGLRAKTLFKHWKIYEIVCDNGRL